MAKEPKVHWPAYQTRYCDYSICGVWNLPKSALTRQKEQVTCKNCLRAMEAKDAS